MQSRRSKAESPENSNFQWSFDPNASFTQTPNYNASSTLTSAPKYMAFEFVPETDPLTHVFADADTHDAEISELADAVADVNMADGDTTLIDIDPAEAREAESPDTNVSDTSSDASDASVTLPIVYSYPRVTWNDLENITLYQALAEVWVQYLEAPQVYVKWTRY